MKLLLLLASLAVFFYSFTYLVKSVQTEALGNFSNGLRQARLKAAIIGTTIILFFLSGLYLNSRPNVDLFDVMLSWAIYIFAGLGVAFGAYILFVSTFGSDTQATKLLNELAKGIQFSKSKEKT